MAQDPNAHDPNTCKDSGVTDPLNALLYIRNQDESARWNYDVTLPNGNGLGRNITITYTFLSGIPGYYDNEKHDISFNETKDGLPVKITGDEIFEEERFSRFELFQKEAVTISAYNRH